MIAVATLLAVGIGAWWMWQARSGPGPAGTTAPRAEEAAPADGPSSQPAPPPADADSVPPAVPGRESPGDGQLPQSGPVAPSRSGGLTLRFAGPCWLEVYDAAGTRLAFELAQTGAVRSFNGTPPWRVVLGAARSVQLSVDGSAVTIPASLVVRDAALISISGRGEVARTPAGTMQNS
jgi:cytoskeleton protein RodZ